MHFLEPKFQNFLREAPKPLNKRWPPPPCGPNKTTARLFISIVRRLLEVIFPLLQIFGRTLYVTLNFKLPCFPNQACHNIEAL